MRISFDKVSKVDDVSPDMVKKISVSRLCAESFPCKHWCEIILSDGRRRYVQLNGVEIESLVQGVALEKIFESEESCSAFDCSIHFDYSEFRKRVSWKQESAKDVLTRIFKDDFEALVSEDT